MNANDPINLLPFVLFAVSSKVIGSIAAISGIALLKAGVNVDMSTTGQLA